MKKSNWLILIGVSALAGTAAGMLASQESPKKGGLIGAAAGILTGTVSAKIYQCVTEEDNGISYYTKSSQLYQNYNDTEYI